MSAAHLRRGRHMWVRLRLATLACILVCLLLAKRLGAEGEARGLGAWSCVWRADALSESVLDLEFSSMSDGWAVGSRMLRTTDGGDTWESVGEGGSEFALADGNVVWVSGPWGDQGAQVRVTADAGRSWRLSSTRDYLFSISATSAQKAWALALRASTSDSEAADDSVPEWAQGRGVGIGMLLHTENGGTEWHRVMLPLDAEAILGPGAVAFSDERHGWVVGHEEQAGRSKTRLHPLIVFVTGDGGRTFEKVATPAVRASSLLPWQIHFLSNREGWVAPGGPSLLHTTDGAMTWSVVTPIDTEDTPRVALRDCAFPTPQEGWAVGSESVAAEGTAAARSRALILHTSDGGCTWERVEAGLSDLVEGRIDRIDFVDERHGWAVGHGERRLAEGADPCAHAQVSFILRYEE